MSADFSDVSSTVELYGGVWGDVFVTGRGSDTLYGGWGADTLNGRTGADTIYGEAGADKIYGGGGNDVLHGGADDDIYYAVTSGDSVTELAGEGRDTVFAASDYTLAFGQHIEVLSAGSSTSTGTVSLTGNELNQTLNGNASANTLNGAGGVDNLRGYAGADKFLFDRAGVADRDFILDFSHADDTILLDGSIFSALATAASGGLTDANAPEPTLLELSADAFKVIGAGASLDASDRILYSAASGNLFYDADGSGTEYAAVVFATLSTKPTDINHTDFLVV